MQLHTLQKNLLSSFFTCFGWYIDLSHLAHIRISIGIILILITGGYSTTCSCITWLLTSVLWALGCIVSILLQHHALRQHLWPSAASFHLTHLTVRRRVLVSPGSAVFFSYTIVTPSFFEMRPNIIGRITFTFLLIIYCSWGESCSWWGGWFALLRLWGLWFLWYWIALLREAFRSIIHHSLRFLRWMHSLAWLVLWLPLLRLNSLWSVKTFLILAWTCSL